MDLPPPSADRSRRRFRFAAPLHPGCAARRGRFVLCLLLTAAATPFPVAAQEVPNPAFEDLSPAGAPLGWSLMSGAGEVRVVDGDRALVTTGDGEMTSFWASDPLGFAPGVVYRLRLRARRLSGSGGGTVMAGTAFANRDLGAIGDDWRVFSTYFAAPWTSSPGSEERDWLRLGQWHLDGGIAFDDVELHRVQLVHARPAPELELGAGESIAAGHYVFHAPQRTQLANASRPLVAHDAGFNTYRWVFGDGEFVRYRHDVGGRRQTAARIFVNVNYHTGGRLQVEARPVDPQGPPGPESDWTRLGDIDGVRGASFEVPDALLPAAALEVRLRAVGGRQVGAAADPGSFQVDDYRYEADLDDGAPDAVGSTQLLTVSFDRDDLQVAVADAGGLQPGLADTLILWVQRRATSAPEVRLRAVVTGLGEMPAAAGAVPFANGGWMGRRLAAGVNRLQLPYRVTGTGDRTLHVQLETRASGDTAWQSQWRAELDAHASILHADNYGERLPVVGDVPVWWAASGWKVSTTRRVPDARGTALRIATARNETEAAQLVLRPPRDLSDLIVSMTDLRGADGGILGAGIVEVLRVATVPVRQPTDLTGEAADWPDPLLPLDGPLTAPRERNLTLWVRATPPRGVAGGLYRGTLKLRAAGWQADVPVEVEVFDFDLPDRMTCQTAFGFSPGNVWAYHRLERPADRRLVLDRYLASFSAHHISPYDPAPLVRPIITWPDLAGRTISAGDVLEPAVDWAAWDEAMTRAIDELHFNSFRLSIPGMGGGTFVDRREPELLGYGAHTPQYRALFRGYGRAVERHLAERGWLDEAYVYWFDEPAPRDYDFVMAGFDRLRDAAPRITRMLTEQPEAELFGGPDLWCPVTSSYDETAARARQAEGERFWWYVCTVPKAPYPGLFIDHGATELRAWLWQTWQRDIDGILIWATNYWTSGAAYPEARQNPYRDAMSWQSSYNTPVGTRRPWGNGDGRFLYPPPAAFDSGATGAMPTGPILDGPVETIRWEMLRDGIEDYEYLALLERALAAKADRVTADEATAWSALLEVPPSITASATRFTMDPAPMEARRRDVARALEALARR